MTEDQLFKNVAGFIEREKEVRQAQLSTRFVNMAPAADINRIAQVLESKGIVTITTQPKGTHGRRPTVIRWIGGWNGDASTERRSGIDRRKPAP